MLNFAKIFTKPVILRSVYSKRIFSKWFKFKLLISHGRVITLAYTKTKNTLKLTNNSKHDAHHGRRTKLIIFIFMKYNYNYIINKSLFNFLDKWVLRFNSWILKGKVGILGKCCKWKNTYTHFFIEILHLGFLWKTKPLDGGSVRLNIYKIQN